MHKRFVFAMALLASAGTFAWGTPSTQVWIPSTDVEAYGSFHLGVDVYTTVFTDAADGAQDFPTDFGLTVGVSPSETILLEIREDLLEPRPTAQGDAA